MSFFFFPIVLWYQFFVSGFQQLFVFGIKKEFFRVYQGR
ncbi:putative membrane protein [Bacteroides fragilis str. S13 L11]|nr:putative membrane protein [Bacteroides fragilis str. S13 L11]